MNKYDSYYKKYSLVGPIGEVEKGPDSNERIQRG